MFKLTINVQDAQNSIVDQATKYTKSINNEVVNRMRGAGEIIRTNVVKILKGPRSGKIYTLPNGKKHQASAPGEPPAQETGNLRKSFRAKTEKKIEGRKLTVTAMAVSNTSKNAFGVKSKGRTPNENYAWIDEGMGKIKPRPYSRKVAEQSFDKISALLIKRYHV